eukprot:TRINITY_DN2731_c0_g1_i2.p1 TRINITY_DN2731_c0_g1~~TRINITY_DN2731_c0_g1_i2.p1  ORF type:complete len:418 (-),score=89.84 TRINITY_DN2731_c0_g1_i2:63-1247(-)
MSSDDSSSYFTFSDKKTKKKKLKKKQDQKKVSSKQSRETITIISDPLEKAIGNKRRRKEDAPMREVVTRNELESVIEEKKFTGLWVDLYNPSSDTLSVFWSYGLHLFTIEDCLDKENGTVKHQALDEYQIIVDREFFIEDDELSSHLINMYVFKKLIITVHWRNFDSFDSVLSAVHEKPENIRFPEWVSVCIMDELCSRLKGIIVEMIDFIEILDRRVYADLNGDTGTLLSEISFYFQSTKMIGYYLTKKRDLLQQCEKHNKYQLSVVVEIDCPITPEVGIIPYLSILEDQLGQMERDIVFKRSQLEVLSNTYMTRVSIELAKVSNEMNQSMKLFGVVTTIFLPISIIAGLMGMNVEVPGQTVAGLGYFWGIVGMSLTYIIVVTILLAKFKFLN